MNFVNLWMILVEKLRIQYRLGNSGNRNELRNEWTGSPYESYYDLGKEQVGWGIRLWLWLWLVVGHTSSSGASASKNNEKKTLHHKFFWGVHQGQTRCFLGGGREELDCRSPFQSPTPDLRATIWEMFFFAETDRAEHFQNHLKQTSLAQSTFRFETKQPWNTISPWCFLSKSISLTQI